MGRHVAPLALALAILATTVLFAWKLIFTGLVVIGYDTMTYMYPYRAFAAEALRDGRIPLWNPWIYFGVPFLSNLQSAVFYPLHVLFLVLPAPFAMNASVAVHFFLAAWFAALAARGMADLDWWSAGIAGCLYGFSGFIGAQVGHLNQLNAAVWLPLACLTLHYALRSHSLRWAVATGVILAIQLLAGHAQESYMTVVAIGAYAVFRIGVAGWTLALPARAPARDPLGTWVRAILADRPRNRTEGTAPIQQGQLGGGTASEAHFDQGRWGGRSEAHFDQGRWGGEWVRRRIAFRHAAWTTGLLGLSGGIAAGLSALQTLPTTELTAASIRAGGMPLGEAVAFSLPPRELFVGLLPTFGLATPTSNEYLGWLGFMGFILVLCGVTFRARHPAILFFTLLGLVSLLLALGNHTPIYSRIFALPGMNLFRVPARWLFLTTFAGSIVAGAGFSFLKSPGPDHHGAPAPRPWYRLIAASRLLIAVLVASGAATLLWPAQHVRSQETAPQLIVVWAALGTGAVVLTFIALATAPSRLGVILISVATIAELWASATTLEYNNPNPPGVYTDSRPVIDALRDNLPPGRVLAVARTGYQPYDAPLIQGDHGALLGLRGVGAGLINTKYKDTLNPNLPMVFKVPVVDGYDGGVLPFRRYVDFKSLIVPPERNQADGLLRDQLSRDLVPTLPSLFRLRQLGVSYVVRDTIDDRQIDGVYYDADATLTVRTGSPVNIPAPVLALPSVLARADLPQGSAPASLTASIVGPAAPGPPMRDVRAIGMIVSRATTELGVTTMTITARDARDAPLWTGRFTVTPETTGTGASPATVTPLPGTDPAKPSMYLVRLPVSVNQDTTLASFTYTHEATGLVPTDTQASTLHALSVIGDGQSWPASLIHGGGLQLVHRSDVKVYRLLEPPLRVRLVSKAVIRPSAAEALNYLRDASEGDDSVVLETAPVSDPNEPAWRTRLRPWRDAVWRFLGRNAYAGYLSQAEHESIAKTTRATGITFSGGAVVIEAETAEYLMIRVDTPVQAILTVQDSFFAGWTATIDGRDVPVWRADVLFRALPVPAGQHVVEMRFRQTSAETGFTISVVSALLAVVIMVIPWTATSRRQWPPSRPLSGPGEGYPDQVGRAERTAANSGEAGRANGNVSPSGATGRVEATHLPAPTVPAERARATVDPDAIPRERPPSEDVATTRIPDDDTHLTALFIASTDDPEVAREAPWKAKRIGNRGDGVAEDRRPRPPVPSPGQDGELS